MLSINYLMIIYIWIYEERALKAKAESEYDRERDLILKSNDTARN